MKCPSCGYNTFDTYERCKRCGARLSGPVWGDRIQVFNKPGSKYDKESDDDSKKLFGEHQDPIDPNEDPKVLDEELSQEDKDSYHIVSKTANPVTEQDEEAMLTLASFLRRVFAFLIDIFIIFLVSFVTLIFGLFMAGYDPVKGLINLSFIILPVYIILTLLASSYLIFLHAFSGKTLGKLIMGIRVVNEDGYSIGLYDSFVRWVGYFLSAVPLFYGYFSALFDMNYQTWHDKLSKSYVVRDG